MQEKTQTTGEERASYIQEFKYGYHDLHKLSLFQPPPKRNEEQHHDAVWLIYIHGGAWRDPTITDRSFDHTVDILLSSPWLHKIKGFASLSYRLSPYPDQKLLSSTSEISNQCPNSNQEAKHPDHIHDILMGLDYLQKNFKVGNQYVLVGHSCGATLAFQTLMSQFNHTGFIKPKIIVGVAGIYNLRGLRDRNPSSGYEDFISGAFGKDEKEWDSASPVNMIPSKNPWQGGKMAVLVSSTGDELIDPKQVEEFEKTLKSYFIIRVLTWRRLLNCSHDDIWKKAGLAEVLETVLNHHYYDGWF